MKITQAMSKKQRQLLERSLFLVEEKDRELPPEFVENINNPEFQKYKGKIQEIRKKGKEAVAKEYEEEQKEKEELSESNDTNYVYDKVEWHYPEGDAPDLESAKKHFIVIMNWLKKRKLLSQHGLRELKKGIDDEFAITRDMLTDEGRELMDHYYETWLDELDYNRPVNDKYWERVYRNWR